MISPLIAQEHGRLRPYTPQTSTQRKLDRLIRLCATIVRLKGTLKMTMRHLGGFAPELKAVGSKLDLIAKIDATMSALAAPSPQHQEAQHRLETIVGVGPLVGISLNKTLERVSFGKPDAFVAFTGLDPRANDSGRKAGRRRLSKRDPAELRRVLFNAAMSAIKTKVWKPLYEHYRTTFHPERITKGLT